MTGSGANIVIAGLLALLLALVGYVALTNNSQAKTAALTLDELTKWNSRQDLALQSVEIWQDNHDVRHGVQPRRRAQRPGFGPNSPPAS